MIKLLLILLFSCVCVLCASSTLGLKDTQGEPLHLTDIKLKAIVNLEAPYKEVQYLLTYKNSKDHPLEAIFHFPRNGDFIFHKFEAIFPNKTLVGKIIAKEDNHTQAYSSSKLITLSIGKLQTNETVQILFSVIQPLKAVLNKFFELKFPAITSQDSPFIFDQDPKIWNIQVEITSKKPLVILSNPTHWLEPKQSRSPHYKALWNTTIPTYQDFTVYFAPENLSNIELLSVTHPDDPNDHIFQFSALPDLRFFSDAFVQNSLQNKLKDGMLTLEKAAFDHDQIRFPPPYIFMTDRSDSMKGARFETLKKTLIKILQTLPDWGREVEILSFGSTVGLYRIKNKYGFDRVPSVQQAIEYVRTLEADMGKKDLLKAMEYVADEYEWDMMFDKPVILLTDGEITSNSDKIIQIVSKESRHFRTCAVGIGSNEESKSLLHSIASAGRCRSEFIQENEDLGEKVFQFMKNSVDRFGFDLVSWFFCEDENGKIVGEDGCESCLIFADQIVDSWFYVDNESEINSCEYSVEIYSEGRQIFYETEGEISDFGNSEITDTNFYHKIAYSSKLKSLEAKIKNAYYAYNPYRDEKSNIQKVIDQSLKYQILSDFTQLVAVLQETVPSFITTGSKRDIQSFEL